MQKGSGNVSVSSSITRFSGQTEKNFALQKYKTIQDMLKIFTQIGLKLQNSNDIWLF